jgi:ribosomal protein RSM22 (predicted rRNA methylase)
MIDSLFNALSAETHGCLDALIKCMDRTFPLPGRFISALPRNVAELSRLLTSARPERKDGYLGNPALLQAYMRYFLMWNVYRLCKVFSSMEISSFLMRLFLENSENPTIIDLGSGPLTLSLALWISFPQLRSQKLTLFSVDHNKTALQAGKKLFASFTGECGAWEVKTINADIYANVKIKPATLVCAINVFNELYWKIPQADAEKMTQCAERSARLISTMMDEGAAALVVEPGVPRCGQFVSVLKEAFEARRIGIRSPCPANASCAARGGKRGSKWCHFNFDVDDSPVRLQKLSLAAGLAKDKAVLSFLLAEKGTKAPSPRNNASELRVISDSFALPENKCGRYACSKRGLVLLRGEERGIDLCKSGTLLSVENPVFCGRDKKSGAEILNVLQS